MQNNSPEEGWCLLLVKPGKEQAAQSSFRRYGLMAYWPNYESYTHGSELRRMWGRLKRRSVIPGYLFVEGPANEAFWRVTQRIDDIINIARTYSGLPVTLRESDIATIRSIEAGLNTPKPGKSLHSFKTGDRVRFKDSSWPPGVVGKSTGDGRLVVEVELMGRVVPVTVFPHQIEKG